MDDTLSGDIGYWIGESRDWPCTCRGAEMFLCDRCNIEQALTAASGHVADGKLAAAARAVRRAAQIEGRLVELRDRLDAEVHSAPYESMHLAIGTEPVVGGEPRFPGCGMTVAEHREITADVIRREVELDRIRDLVDPEAGVRLALANHPRCGSTLSWELPGHVRDDGSVVR